MGKKKKQRQLIVVSGLIRSGTSAVMQVIRKSGIQIIGHKFSLYLNLGEKSLDCGSYQPRDEATGKNKDRDVQSNDVSDAEESHREVGTNAEN